MVPQIRPGWRAWLALTLSLVLLNASLAFENVWPTPKIAWGHALSLELAVCVLILALLGRKGSTLARRVLPAVWVALVAGHYLDVTAPGLYGREFNVYWDSQHLGNVAAMLARAAPWWLLGATAAMTVIAIWGAFVVARLALGHVGAAMAHRRARIGLGALAGCITLLFAGQRISDNDTVAFADPVTPAYVRQARFALAMFGNGTTGAPLGPSPALDTRLRAVDGVDVLLVFVESYGAITYETPAISEGLAESRADLETAIRDTGRHVMSAFVDSPTFGGSSWLAHLSLLSGVDVRDQYAYSALMASERDTIVTNFSRRGYRTVALMPGMRQPWPEGAFYGFDVIYGRDALEYEGPEFGWWSIPDQYALARLDVLERNQGSRAPVFVVFPTSTTHAPFGPVPPYQSAWSRVLTSKAFDETEVARAMAIAPDLTNLTPSYVRAMAYEYRSLGGYLRQQAHDLVLVVVGDHQPPAAVSGRDAPWHVPVHVIANRPDVLGRLRDAGFRPGLEPRRPSIGVMHELTPMLLEAFDTPAPYLDTLNGSLEPPTASASRPPRTGRP